MQMPKKIFYSWNSIALNPENSNQSTFLDLSSLPAEDALAVAYPNLNFCELVDLIQKMKTSIPLDETVVFQNYGFALDSKMQKLMALIPQLPSPFWHWCRNHSLSPRDLYPLLSLESPQQLQKCLMQIQELNLSRNLGTQILELLVECFLLNANQELLIDFEAKTITNATSGDAWLQKLKNQRFPQTLQSDANKQKELLTLPWTKELQTRWLRQGDRSGVEVRFFASNPKELQKRVEQLQQVVQSTSGIL
jgi:hypothetical protein